jgi:hypothetical protein
MPKLKIGQAFRVSVNDFSFQPRQERCNIIAMNLHRMLSHPCRQLNELREWFPTPPRLAKASESARTWICKLRSVGAFISTDLRATSNSARKPGLFPDSPKATLAGKRCRRGGAISVELVIGSSSLNKFVWYMHMWSSDTTIAITGEQKLLFCPMMRRMIEIVCYGMGSRPLIFYICRQIAPFV